jgi:pimeloyl-ACP methyl ester carboxylesterase
MKRIHSHDGTDIAYEVAGSGPSLILVDGATQTRSSGSKPELISVLAEHFTVVSYDRRGRGDSGDTLPYAVQREVEDIAALIGETGEPALLYGHSSGGSLAFEAALALGPRVAKLAMYEVPYDDDPASRAPWAKYLADLSEALGAGRHGDAIALFMAYVGMPAEQIEAIRQAPFWGPTEAIAPTLAYDHTAILGPDKAVPVERARMLSVPALVLYGGAGEAFIAETAKTLAAAIPDAELRVVPGEGHQVSPTALAPFLVGFFLGDRSPVSR